MTVEKLRRVLGPVAREIQHVGSTAVPDLFATPILDLVVGVRSLEEAAAN